MDKIKIIKNGDTNCSILWHQLLRRNLFICRLIIEQKTFTINQFAAIHAAVKVCDASKAKLLQLVGYITHKNLTNTPENLQYFTKVMHKKMKILLLVTGLFICQHLQAQTIENIAFHLYTDSLKKGVHNYINVDATLSNGRYLPLTQKELIFWSNTGKFINNDLIIDSSYKGDSVIIKATLKNNTSLSALITVFIKKMPDDSILKTEAEILQNMNKNKKNKP